MPASASPSPAEIVAALQRGGLVEALKLVVATKRTGASTRKQVAAPVASRPKASEPSSITSQLTDLSPGEVPRSNSDVWLLLLIAALAIGYYLFAS